VVELLPGTHKAMGFSSSTKNKLGMVPATRRADIRRTMVGSQPRQTV
jgi:hypothetical protein